MKHMFSAYFLLFFSLINAQNYTEEEVSIGNLKGTISTPSEKSKTAALLISGSGPTDRDGNSALGFTNNSLKMVASSLVEAGYAVLRFDKRGIAASRGAIEDPKALRFDHFVEDAGSWVEYLSDQGYENIVVIGHSQGSLVGMLASQDNDKVVGLISLAGLAVDAGAAIEEQIGKQAPVLSTELKSAMDSLRNGHSVNKVNPFLVSVLGPQIQEFLKSYIKYNPADEIQKLDIPILILNGTTDIQVGVDQAEALQKVAPGAKIKIIEGMNHILKDAPLDPAANVATYNNPDLPLSNGVMDEILSFIKNL